MKRCGASSSTASTTRPLAEIVARLGALEMRDHVAPGVRTELRQAVRTPGATWSRISSAMSRAQFRQAVSSVLAVC